MGKGILEGGLFGKGKFSQIGRMAVGAALGGGMAGVGPFASLAGAAGGGAGAAGALVPGTVGSTTGVAATYGTGTAGVGALAPSSAVLAAPSSFGMPQALRAANAVRGVLGGQPPPQQQQQGPPSSPAPYGSSHLGQIAGGAQTTPYRTRPAVRGSRYYG